MVINKKSISLAEIKLIKLDAEALIKEVLKRVRTATGCEIDHMLIFYEDDQDRYESDIDVDISLHIV